MNRKNKWFNRSPLDGNLSSGAENLFPALINAISLTWGRKISLLALHGWCRCMVLPKTRSLEKSFVEFHGSHSLAVAVWRFFFHKGISAGLSIFLRLNVSVSGRVSLTFKHFKALVSQFKKLEFLWLTKKIACLNSQTLPLNVRCFLVKTKR